MRSDSHTQARFLIEEAWITEISESDRRWLGGHLAGCAECAAYAEDTSRILEDLRSLSFETGVVKPIAPPPERTSSPRLAIAAAVVLALVAPAAYEILWNRRHDARGDVSDRVLWERVEANVGREIPQALAPLGSGGPQ